MFLHQLVCNLVLSLLARQCFGLLLIFGDELAQFFGLFPPLLTGCLQGISPEPFRILKWRNTVSFSGIGSGFVCKPLSFRLI